MYLKKFRSECYKILIEDNFEIINNIIYFNGEIVSEDNKFIHWVLGCDKTDRLPLETLGFVWCIFSECTELRIMCIDRGFEVIDNNNEILMSTHSLYTPNEIFQYDFADLITLLFQKDDNNKMSNDNRMSFTNELPWYIPKTNYTKLYESAELNSNDTERDDNILRSHTIGPVQIQNRKIRLVSELHIVDIMTYLKDEFGVIKMEVYDGKNWITINWPNIEKLEKILKTDRIKYRMLFNKEL